MHPQVFDNGVNPKDTDADEGNSGSKCCVCAVRYVGFSSLC